MLHVRVNVPPDPGAIEALAEGLVQLNCWYMETALDHGVPVPPLYKSGVVYRREPPGQEWWETASDVMGVITNRSGDCEDLAAYRAAWLRTLYDEDASVVIRRTRRGTFHAVVERGDGTIEDPSRILVDLERQRKEGR